MLVEDRFEAGSKLVADQLRTSVMSCIRVWRVYVTQGKGKMNTYWLVGEKDDPQTAVQLKQLLREVRKEGKQLRHAL